MIDKINSKYDGNYDEFDRRHHRGLQKWKQRGKEQKYNGEFFRDCLHGEGIYKWQKENGWEIYDGYFYANVKEGYGMVSLPNGSSFEGLFCNNRLFGPGVLTYENGRQDAGFWSGTKIIRLSRVVDYIVPRLASSSVGKMKLFSYRKIITLNSGNMAEAAVKQCKSNTELAPRLYSNFINDPRSLFFNRKNFNKSYFEKLNHKNIIQKPNFWSDDIENDLESDKDDEETDFLNYTSHGIGLGKSRSVYKQDSVVQIDENLEIDLICWNRNKVSEEMVKQIFNLRSLEDKLSFKISSLITGDRLEFKKTGHKEKECINFLKMCSIGPPYIAKELICSSDISEELTDARGNNSLMFAACADQHDIIDILLDHGVDINSFNDEHLTPLNLCLLRRIAQGNTILNWERAFLPPAPESDSIVGPKMEDSEGTKSIESLDRLFGDGMSINENPIPAILPSVQQESFANFEERHDTTFSAVTVLKFNQRIKPAKTESIYYDKNETSMVPKTIRREEYLNSIAEPIENDKYFFDLSPEPTSAVETKKPAKGREVKEVIIEVEEEEPKDEEMIKKCEIINKTLEKLLRRGADANISDVPKSSLHLGVFTKDSKVVKMLLKFNAFVDTRNPSDEGFLTPLHVIVLTKPEEDLVLICEILLEYNADPEAETAPDFNPNGEREIFLDEEHGRTPLQLLCMRPDLEYVKHNKYLIEIALTLARISNRKNYFKGYNFLTLAMLRGNIKLLEAFLTNRTGDPNEVCEHGTPLHVLVSTFCQIRVPFDESIQMCDLLLNNGADPLKKSAKGNCVEFGYREIEEEKEKRKLEKGKDKGKGRDHLKDHIKVVEYLDKKVKDLEEKMKKELEQKMRKKLKVTGECDEDIENIAEKMRGSNRSGKMKTEEKDTKGRQDKGRIEDGERGNKGKLKDTDGQGKKGKSESSDGQGKSEGDEYKAKKEKGKTHDQEGKKKNEKEKIDAKEKKEDAEKGAGMDESDTEDRKSKIRASPRNEKDLKDLNKTKGGMKENKSSFQDISKKKKADKSDVTEAGKKKTDKKGRNISDDVQAKDRRKRKGETEADVKKLKEKEKFEKSAKYIFIKGEAKDRRKRKGVTETDVKKLKEKEKFEKSTKDIFIKGEALKDRSGNLSEKLQKLLNEILGNCQDSIDVNDLLLPYAVLRDGDLYYHFKEQKPKNMEAYSLI